MSRATAILTLVASLGLLAGCATSHSTAIGKHSERKTITAAPDSGLLIARAALDVLGTPYRYGGNNENGFDCSGLVQYAHTRAGISIPRTTATQFSSARKISDGLQVGDVLFFRINGRISHNGIYVGRGQFVHAPKTGKNVSIVRTDNPYFRKRLAGVRRFH